jgi:hypothetical protein
LKRDSVVPKGEAVAGRRHPFSPLAKEDLEKVQREVGNGRRTVPCSGTRPLTMSALSVNEERCGERSLQQADNLHTFRDNGEL